ncbi:MAG: plasmid pRiA4b ORF-3 family protein [Galactobacter sp.]
MPLLFESMWRSPAPKLLPVPAAVRGFRIRLDLQDTKPPVWRRFDVAGDITLPRLHHVIQVVMGWTDSHLHRFGVGAYPHRADFLTTFDVEEGVEGLAEDGVRLDQVVAGVGDRLYYEYDFGDGWRHVLKVESVLETPPARPNCITGKRECPPEDCGGIWGYSELAAWVRSGYDEASRPDVFDSTEEALMWLGEDWDPDVFDVDFVNESLADMAWETVAVAAEVNELMGREERYGSDSLRTLLATRASAGTTEVTAEDARRLVEPFVHLLDVIGDGIQLTQAGYLPPSSVAAVAEAIGLRSWWLGKLNREDSTWPVAQLREAARSLGLVSVRKGLLAATQAARRCKGDPVALLNHIAGRLPLSRVAHERDAGWVALMVAGAGAAPEQWDSLVSELLFKLGWRDGLTGFGNPPSDSPTMTVLRILAGKLRGRDLDASEGPDEAVAAFARAVLRA